MKQCRSCLNFKEEIDFAPSELLKNKSICRKCVSEYKKEYRIDNREKIKNQQHNHYENNKERVLGHNKDYRKNNKEKLSDKKKEIYKNNREEILMMQKEYYEENRDIKLKYQKNYQKNNRDKINHRVNEKLKNDPIFKLRAQVSKAVWTALNSKCFSKNGSSILNYLSENYIKDLKIHFEKQFELWMSWENWGKYDPNIWDDNDQSTWTWQIDHIIPQSDLPYTSMEDDNFKKCWALENLRPLSAKQNILEGTKRIRHEDRKKKA